MSELLRDQDGFPGRFRSARRGLAAAQKPSRGVSLYSIRLNRPAGRHLAAVAAAARLTPNLVTVLSALVSLSAITTLVAAPRGLVAGVAVALLLMLGFALDAADGQLARLQRSGSPAGEWLDHVIDCAVKVLLHDAVLFALYRDGERGGVLLLPLAFQAAAVLLFFGGTMAGTLLGQAREASPTAARHPAPRRGAAIALLLVDYGITCASFFLWGTTVFLFAYGVLLAAQAVYLAGFGVRWFRELRTVAGA